MNAMHRFAFLGFVTTMILFDTFNTMSSVISGKAEDQTILHLQWNGCSWLSDLTLNNFICSQLCK